MAWGRLGLVSYDTDVNVDAPMTRMDSAGKAELLSKVKRTCVRMRTLIVRRLQAERCILLQVRRLSAGTATNLSGGLFEGLAIAKVWHARWVLA